MNNGTHIKDGVIYSGGATSADQIAYDNTNSGLEATNTQEAVDELSSDLTQLKTPVLLASGAIGGSGTITLNNWDDPTKYHFIILQLRSGITSADVVTIPLASFMGGSYFMLKYNDGTDRRCHMVYNQSTKTVTLTLVTATSAFSGWSYIISAI